MYLTKLISARNKSKTFFKIITSSSSELLEDGIFDWIRIRIYLGVCLMFYRFEATLACVWTGLNISFFTLLNFSARGSGVLEYI